HLLYNEPCKIVPQDIFTPNKWHLTKNYRRCLVIKMASKDTAQLILGTISVQASENDQGFFQQTLIRCEVTREFEVLAPRAPSPHLPSPTSNPPSFSLPWQYFPPPG